jgi:hypothetical protein
MCRRMTSATSPIPAPTKNLIEVVRVSMRAARRIAHDQADLTAASET